MRRCANFLTIGQTVGKIWPFVSIFSFDTVAKTGNKVECCFDKVERCFDIVAGVDRALVNFAHHRVLATALN